MDLFEQACEITREHAREVEDLLFQERVRATSERFREMGFTGMADALEQVFLTQDVE